MALMDRERSAPVEVTNMVERSAARSPVGNLVEVLLPLLILGLLIALCVQLLVPFVGLLLWTIILAVCFYPLHRRLMSRVGNRLSATVIGTALAALILVPTAIAAISAASSIPDLVAALQSGERQVRPPPAMLLNVPLVGAKIHALWAQASSDMPAFAQKFGPQLATFTKWLVAQAGGMVAALLALVLAVIFAAITLAYAESVREAMLTILARITGNRARGLHYMSVIGATVRSVANGVIGVAFVQALLCGIGFFVVGIPGAGILSVLAMVLGVLQVPVLLVTLPAIIFAFSVKSTTVAILFTVWFLVSGLSDAALKPLMIGHGLEVPMPIILLGVIGGVIAYGLVGLFFGAVLLAVGWVLLREWLEEPMPADVDAAATLRAAE
jgi:predicted PurR-regulated permease PerM